MSVLGEVHRGDRHGVEGMRPVTGGGQNIKSVLSRLLARVGCRSTTTSRDVPKKVYR